MTKEDYQKQLNDLRLKWKVFPKSYVDKDWPKFRVDKSKAIYLIEQIRKIDAGEMTDDQMEEIFTK